MLNRVAHTRGKKIKRPKRIWQTWIHYILATQERTTTSALRWNSTRLTETGAVEDAGERRTGNEWKGQKKCSHTNFWWESFHRLLLCLKPCFGRRASVYTICTGFFFSASFAFFVCSSWLLCCVCVCVRFAKCAGDRLSPQRKIY